VVLHLKEQIFSVIVIKENRMQIYLITTQNRLIRQNNLQQQQ
jgi:rRNA pseudouridine-1189 N-methylase Emg1 (Nep1/Mra1 family)